MTDDRERTPRWVMVAGLIAAVLALLFLVLALVGRGGHGPGRHALGDDAGGHTGAPPAVTHTRP